MCIKYYIDMHIYYIICVYYHYVKYEDDGFQHFVYSQSGLPMVTFVLIIIPHPSNHLRPRTRFGNRFESITYLDPRSSNVLTRPLLPRQRFTGIILRTNEFLYETRVTFLFSIFHLGTHTFTLAGSILCILGVTCIPTYNICFFILSRDS